MNGNGALTGFRVENPNMGSRLGWYALQAVIIVAVTVYGHEVLNNEYPGSEHSIGVDFIMGVIIAFGVTYGLSSLFARVRARRLRRSMRDRGERPIVPEDRRRLR